MRHLGRMLDVSLYPHSNIISVNVKLMSLNILLCLIWHFSSHILWHKIQAWGCIKNYSSQAWAKWVFSKSLWRDLFNITVIKRTHALTHTHTNRNIDTHTHCLCLQQAPRRVCPLLFTFPRKEVMIQPYSPEDCLIWQCLPCTRSFTFLHTWNVEAKQTWNLLRAPVLLGKGIAHLSHYQHLRCEDQALGHLPLACQHWLKGSLTHLESCCDVLIRTHLHGNIKACCCCCIVWNSQQVHKWITLAHILLSPLWMITLTGEYPLLFLGKIVLYFPKTGS